MCTRTYLSLLGQRLASTIQTGEDVDYTCALNRTIPLPPGADAEPLLRSIEDAVCSLDIVQELHPDMPQDTKFQRRVLCGNRIALWRLLSTANEMPKEKTTAPLEEDVSSSWRIPLLKYGNESTTGKAFVELHVRAERVSAALSSPDIIASHHDDAWQPAESSTAKGK